MIRNFFLKKEKENKSWKEIKLIVIYNLAGGEITENLGYNWNTTLIQWHTFDRYGKELYGKGYIYDYKYK